jgi:hypothetical protein
MGASQEPHLSNLIGSVDDHLGLGDERQAQNDIHHDVASCGNDEAGGSALTSQVGQMKSEQEGVLTEHTTAESVQEAIFTNIHRKRFYLAENAPICSGELRGKFG